MSTETFLGLDTAGDVYAGRPVAVATVLEHPNAAVVGRRLVVRLSSAGDGGSQPGMVIDSLKADARHLRRWPK